MVVIDMVMTMLVEKLMFMPIPRENDASWKKKKKKGKRKKKVI